MRFLTIQRHAHASPAAAGQSDYERPLSERGRTQCAQLREWVLDERALGAYGPVTALVSAAVRTRETFRRAVQDTPFVGVVHESELIYNGRREVSAEDLLIDLAAIDPVTTSLLVVAHNPTVEELLFSLAEVVPESVRREGFPVGGAFVLALRENEQIGLARYPVVAQYVPD